MIKSKKEAKRYAKTILDTFGLEGTPKAISEFSLINGLMVKSKEFKTLLVSPLFTQEEREKAIKHIAEDAKLSQETVKYIMYLSELGLIIYLAEIIRIATALYLEKKKKARVIVMTPITVAKNYEDRLKSFIKKLIDREVDIEYVMDPSLLGGVVVKVDSTMYDTSIKGQLRLLKNELIKG